jgi:hypothetical protein
MLEIEKSNSETSNNSISLVVVALIINIIKLAATTLAILIVATPLKLITFAIPIIATPLKRNAYKVVRGCAANSAN